MHHVRRNRLLRGSGGFGWEAESSSLHCLGFLFDAEFFSFLLSFFFFSPTTHSHIFLFCPSTIHLLPSTLASSSICTVHEFSHLANLHLRWKSASLVSSVYWFLSAVRHFVIESVTEKSDSLSSITEKAICWFSSSYQRKPPKTHRPPQRKELFDNLSMYSSCVRNFEYHLPHKLQTFRYVPKPCSFHSKSCGWSLENCLLPQPSPFYDTTNDSHACLFRSIYLWFRSNSPW